MIPLFERDIDLKELSLLVVISPPGGPVVSRVHKGLFDLVHGYFAFREVLNLPVPANVITVTVGTYDKIYFPEIDPSIPNKLLRILEIRDIAGVYEDLFPSVENEMIGIEPSSLNEKEILRYLRDHSEYPDLCEFVESPCPNFLKGLNFISPLSILCPFASFLKSGKCLICHKFLLFGEVNQGGNRGLGSKKLQCSGIG